VSTFDFLPVIAWWAHRYPERIELVWHSVLAWNIGIAAALCAARYAGLKDAIRAIVHYADET
jgi:hypothetical protein